MQDVPFTGCAEVLKTGTSGPESSEKPTMLEACRLCSVFTWQDMDKLL